MRWWRHGVCVEQRHAHLSGCGDPAQSKSASPREQPLFASDQQCILSCMFHRRWHVGLGFFFNQSFWSLSPPQLVSYNCLLAYHVSGSINGFLAPCWHWYRCCDKALLLAPLTFLSALTLLSKFFSRSFEIDIAIVCSIEQYRYG